MHFSSRNVYVEFNTFYLVEQNKFKLHINSSMPSIELWTYNTFQK